MTRVQAKKLSDYHKFTKSELYDILKNALEKLPENYWKKANSVNPIFDNGYYFNQCRKWLDYQPGLNDNEFVNKIVVIRILQGFGNYSNIQLPQKNKPIIEIQGTEKPSLI